MKTMVSYRNSALHLCDFSLLRGVIPCKCMYSVLAMEWQRTRRIIKNMCRIDQFSSNFTIQLRNNQKIIFLSNKYLVYLPSLRTLGEFWDHFSAANEWKSLTVTARPADMDWLILKIFLFSKMADLCTRHQNVCRLLKIAFRHRKRVFWGYPHFR